MKNQIYLNLLLSVCSLLICFAVGEVGIRYFGTYDEDGNFTFYEHTLKPYHLSTATITAKVEQYLRLSATPPATLTLVYDAKLGWSPRPNSQSADGFFSYNSVGIRSAPAEYSPQPPPGTLRIALFGDSFTHGSEVPFENTWGYYLEDNLKKAGIEAEVINFGVDAYGIDQAYLRWKELGYKFSPDIVILGLQMENVIRNVNLIRPLYRSRTGIPFSKPRFVLNEDRLELLNVPTISPERIPVIIENIETWDLVKYEYFFNPEDYQERIWLKSKLAAFSLEVARPNANDENQSLFRDEDTWDLSKEPAQLTLRIIQEFKQDVESQGRQFLIVRLPILKDVDYILADKAFPYAALLEKIDEENEIIYPEREQLQEVIALYLSSANELFTREGGGHYSAIGNQVIADTIADYIIQNKIE